MIHRFGLADICEVCGATAKFIRASGMTCDPGDDMWGERAEIRQKHVNATHYPERYRCDVCGVSGPADYPELHMTGCWLFEHEQDAQQSSDVTHVWLLGLFRLHRVLDVLRAGMTLGDLQAELDR